jgi:hypothetical protein
MKHDMIDDRQRLDARAEAELRDWRRAQSDDLAANVDRLGDLASACKLEELWAEQQRARGAGRGHARHFMH